jgi:galactose mutarotase-like enzyme
MFAIAVKQNQYLTYVLEDKASLSRLEVVPARGGMVTRWKIQGQNILYLDEGRFANAELSVRGGIPILFPICGNLAGNRYVEAQKSYELKQHGFARDLPWDVTEQTTDSCASLTLVLKSNGQTLSVYPFDFQLTFTYQIQDTRLLIRQQFSNHSSKKMPFAAGLHPYFWVKDKTQLSFEIPASEYQDQHTLEVSPFTGGFDLAREEIDVIFPALTGSSATLNDQKRRFKIEINYSDLYSKLVFWTVQGKEYVCLEPWTAGRNALNTGESLTYLEPGDTCEGTVEMIYSHLS